MDAVAEIKSRINIEDVVSEYVQLKRSGRNFKGLSPFTNEKSPSFMVSPEKQIWHDFSSGKGGDIFSFIQEVEGLDFKGALELLARKAGVDLDDFRTKNNSESSQKNFKDRLYRAIETAVSYYQVQLTKNNTALKYLREKRSYEKQTLIDFRFGYSPESGTALYNFLTSRGFTDEELLKAGLVTKRGLELRDMFRGRIMIPLLDAQGRPVGFTARQLKDNNNSPKYINTPATILYDKGRQVFGLSQAKEAIRKSGFVVVVEGNLDVVASHQAGIKQVVASAGTALTTYHLKSLQRFTGDVRLCFDEDRAGQEALERSIPLAQSLGIELGIISIPSGKDPDELIRKDSKSWQKIIEQSQYMVDWMIEKVASNEDLTTAQGKRQFSAKVMALVKLLKDPIEQEHYLKLIAKRTNTSYETIKDKFQQSASNANKYLRKIKNKVNEPSNLLEQRIREQHLLAMGMKTEEVGKLLVGLPLDVFSDESRETASYIQQHPGVSPIESEYAKMLTLLFEEYYQHTALDELVYQAKMLLARLVAEYAKDKKKTLASELSTTEDGNQKTILLAIKQLDDLVSQFSKHN